MEHPIPENVTAFVRKHSFDYAEYLGVWKGYEVYNPRYNNLNTFGGLTAFALLKNGKIEWSNKKDTDIIEDIFYPDDEEIED